MIDNLCRSDEMQSYPDINRLLDRDDGIRAKFDELNPHDSHHIPILQYVRTYDVVVC